MILDRHIFFVEDKEELSGIWEQEENENEDETVDDDSTSESDSTNQEPDTEDVFDDNDNNEPLGEKGKKALVQTRNELKRLKKELGKYKGINLEEYKQIQEEKQKTEEQRLKDQQQWETLSKKQDRTIKNKDTEIGTLQSQIQQLTKESELKDFYYANEGLQGRSKVDGRTYFDHVKAAVTSRTRREADGSYTVLDTDGYEQQNELGKPKTLNELFDELRDDPFYGHYFKARTKSGGGMPPANTNGQRSMRTPEARMEALKKKMGYTGDSRNKTIFN